MRWLRENASWMSIAVAVAGGILTMFVRDALASTDKRLTLVEQRAADERTIVEKRASDDRETRRLILQKLDALCRATPQANCPLGTE